MKLFNAIAIISLLFPLALSCTWYRVHTIVPQEDLTEGYFEVNTTITTSTTSASASTATSPQPPTTSAPANASCYNLIEDKQNFFNAQTECQIITQAGLVMCIAD